MADDRESFLRVTFGGGRFDAHVMPVDALAELTTLQQLVLELARQEFKRRNPERARVPRGFVEATRLDLAETEHNCFTITLSRKVAPLLPGIDASTLDVVVASRETLLGLLSDPSPQVPPELGPKARKLLTRLGDHLGEGERIDLRARVGATGARVDKASRARLSKWVHEPLEQVVDLDGEVEEFDDRRNEFCLKSREHRAVIVRFDAASRSDIVDALDRRPAVRVRVRGRMRFESPPRVREPEEIEVVDHERKADIDKLWERVEVLRTVSDGWLDGEGEAPTPEVLARARAVLTRLLVEHPGVGRPKLFPTPSGGVQAEWVLGRVAAEVVFSPDEEALEASAAHADRDVDLDRRFEVGVVTKDDATPLAEWLLSIARDGSLDTK